MKPTTEKLKNFQQILKKQDIGAFAVLDIATVNYLTDFNFYFQGDAFLLVTPAQAYCFTKEMYAITLRAAAPFLKLVNSLNPADIAAKAKELKIKNPAFEPALIEYIPGNLLKAAGFAEVKGLIAGARAVKTAGEIVKIKKACQISAAAYGIFRRKLKTGMTEISAAKMLEDIMKDLGGAGLVFGTIMAFGPNGSNPHHKNTGRKLKAEDAVLVDFGCTYQNYCSDITRTFWHGKKPAGQFTHIYNVVKAAHDAGVKAAKTGMTGNDLDAVCRSYIEEASGLAEHFIHATGHSLGMQGHEPPYIRMHSAEILREGMVFTIEPGIYFENKLGVRYENTVLLTKKGAEILTKTD